MDHPIVADQNVFSNPQAILRTASAKPGVGLANYVAVFTDRLMLEAFRNNILSLDLGLPHH